MAEKEYIEREAALNTVEEIMSDYNIYHQHRAIKKRIKRLPAADVAPVRHAKWELIDECINEGVYCSNCHKKIYRAEYANQKVKSKYCPNCGSRMDGDTE